MFITLSRYNEKKLLNHFLLLFHHDLENKMNIINTGNLWKKFYEKNNHARHTVLYGFVKSSSELSGAYLGQLQYPYVCSFMTRVRRNWRRLNTVRMRQDLCSLTGALCHFFLLFTSSQWFLVVNVQVTQLWRTVPIKWPTSASCCQGSGKEEKLVSISFASAFYFVINHLL